MWPLVKEGLRHYRKVLFIAWAIGVAIFAASGVLIVLLGALKTRQEVIVYTVSLPVTFLIASAIACFIAMGTEMSERRLRLHLALPVSVRAVSAARGLLPAAIMLIGLAVAHAVFASARMIPMVTRPGISHLALTVTAGLLLFAVEMVPAVAELVGLAREGRRWEALRFGLMLWVPVGVFVLLQAPLTHSGVVRVGGLFVLSGLVMVLTVERFVRRTQFTH